MKSALKLTALCIGTVLATLALTATAKDKPQQTQNAEKIVRQFWVSPSGSDTNPGTEKRPFATVQQAQKAVRKIDKDGLNGVITVWLDKGVYTLDEPLTFGPQDSGTADLKIVYQSQPGQEVILSGGRAIDRWKKGDDNIWTTYIKDVHDGKWYFRDLYAGTERLTRSRWPNAGEPHLILKEVLPPNKYLTEQQFIMESPLPMDNLAQQDAEAVFLIIWSCSRKLVRSSDATSITTEFPAGYRGHALCEPSIAHKTRVYLENAPAFIDVPGEWYLDRDSGILTLKLADGQTPDTMNITAPVINQLMAVKGTKDSPVTNLHFKGIKFNYANWQLPLAGYNEMQAGVYGMRYIDDPTFMLPSAIHFEYAHSCSLVGSEVACTGANGIAMGAGCRENRLVANNIHDIGGNGVLIGWRQMDMMMPRKSSETDWADPTDAPLANVITDNRIYRCAQVQLGTCGYAEMFSAETVFAHNEVFDLPYTGISTGFTWNHVPTTQRASRIEYNHIHHVMQLLHDGGGIYTLGYQPGTVISNNLVEDVHYGHGIYNDESSSRMLIENNIVNRSGIHAYQLHYGHTNIIRNNIFASSGLHAINHVREVGKASFVFERNIVWMDRYEKHDHPWYKAFLENTGMMLKEGKVKLAAMDSNLYWDTRSTDLKFGDLSWTQWQEDRGQDKNSLIADPKFGDPEKGDFTLPADSPAFKIGFKSIDMSTVGPRKTAH